MAPSRPRGRSGSRPSIAARVPASFWVRTGLGVAPARAPSGANQPLSPAPVSNRTARRMLRTCRVTGLDLTTDLLGAFRDAAGSGESIAGRRRARPAEGLLTGDYCLRARAAPDSPRLRYPAGGVALNGCYGLASAEGYRE